MRPILERCPIRAPGYSVRRASYGNTDWLFTARPRCGDVAPNSWLYYVTGGLALTQLQTDFSSGDSNNGFESGRVRYPKRVYALGAGVEVPVRAG